VNGNLTDRGLLRAVFVAFALLLAYRFLAAVATTALLLATGLLLAVALSAPVEALHRRKAPRPVSVALMVLGAGILLGLSSYLLFPILAKQAIQLTSALPEALVQLVERIREFARNLGIRIGGGDGISPQTLAGVSRRVLGGALGVFTGLFSLFLGLVVVIFIPLYLAAMPETVVGWVVKLFPRTKGRGPARSSQGRERAS
jgi:predicted PurR-regulated permease PerM